jgi:hypothetical protein
MLIAMIQPLVNPRQLLLAQCVLPSKTVRHKRQIPAATIRKLLNESAFNVSDEALGTGSNGKGGR